MARKSAEQIDREVRLKLVKLVNKVNDKEDPLYQLAEAFIDYIDVKRRVLPRDYDIRIKVNIP